MSAVRRMSIAVAGAALGLATVGLPAAAEESIGDQLDATLSDGGAEMAATVDWTTRPEYALSATIEPGTGEVDVLMLAELPVGESAGEVHLRWFPGVVSDEAVVTSVTVDGVAAAPTFAGSLITVPLPAGHGGSIHVIIAFSFTAPRHDPQPVDPLSSGDALQPSDIGLLARTDDGVMLGHWFPTWVPDGLRADADLDGYGDISNFPAATISASVDVPEGTWVVTGGVRIGEPAVEGGRVTYTEGAVGVRDLAVVVMPDADQVERRFGGVDVVVTAPAGTPDLDTVADLTGTAVETLSAGLGAYPWDELDVVAAPLGSGVAGMEWPGMVWIESSVFEGGIPGLGDLGIDMEGIDELLGPDVLGTDGDLGDLGDLFGLGDLGGLGLVIETTREWTIAHEVGHMWWHALVGNDSIAAPVVDEALAQHSACLVERDLRPADADEVCDVNTAGQFQQLQGVMGVSDAPADQATDEFDSSMQYGAVVYGKAPLFYRELEERYGIDETTAALASVVTEYAFDQITPDELRATLGTALGDPAGVDELWQRWIEEPHGADDLPA